MISRAILKLAQNLRKLGPWTLTLMVASSFVIERSGLPDVATFMIDRGSDESFRSELRQASNVPTSGRIRTDRMPSVAVMIVDPAEQAFVKGQLMGIATARFCDSVDSLEHLVAGGGVRAVLCDPKDRLGTDMVPVLRALRDRLPTLP